MKVDAVNRNTSIQHYHQVLARRQDEQMHVRRQEEVRKNYERQRADSVQRARRLGLDKGQHVDVSV